ncbi:MAG: pitrilysin family protein, partial [Deltaproteobacteria bacterium]|nr:pitrilysin family protein [Deltaproteobacteria bacterium]
MPLISTTNVNKYTLSNGLTVLLETNSAAPVISFNVGVKVGSVWEADDEAGLSHLLEHMVFKGTKSYGAGEIAVRVEASGGELNAYTSFDQTVYFINLGARHWKTGLNLIKEMVCDALIDPEELAREKEVVIEEINRGKDNPSNQLSEMLFGTAFKKHPYGRPIIGFEKLVRGFPREKVFGFYKRWYVPNNMVLGICGDFNEGEMKQAIEESFSGYTNHPLTRPTLASEPLPSTQRLVQKGNPVTGHYIAIGYPVPEF